MLSECIVMMCFLFLCSSFIGMLMFLLSFIIVVCVV